MNADLEGRWCWLYNILAAVGILKVELIEGRSYREDDGTVVFPLIIAPRWFWQKRENG